MKKDFETTTSALTDKPSRLDASEQVWRAVKRPHSYNDGTTHRWAVEYTTKDGLTVELGDWLTEPKAHLIAAAPLLLATIKNLHQLIENDFPRTAEKVREVLAKAEGRSP